MTGPILTLRHFRDEQVVHSHEHPQLVFGLSGRLDLEVRGRGAGVDRQGLMIIPTGAHHICGSDGGSDCLVLDVPNELWLLEHLGEHADATRRLLDQPSAIELDFRQQQLVQWLATSPMDNPFIGLHGAVLLLTCLTSSSSAPIGSGRQLPYAAFDAYIQRNSAYPLQVADLARIARLSNARLHARFLSERNITPMEYVRQQRLLKARRLIIQTSLPLGEVGARAGYSSQSAFSAAILRAFGSTPLALRRESGDKSR